MNYNDNLSIVYCFMAKIFHIFVFFLFTFFTLQVYQQDPGTGKSPVTPYNALTEVPQIFRKADVFRSHYHTAYFHGIPADLTAGTSAFITVSAAAVLQTGNSIGMLKNIIIASLLLFLAWLYFYFKKHQKKQRSRIRNMIRSHSRSQGQDGWVTDHVFSNISIEEVAAREDDDLLKKKSEPLMTSETEAKLLELLMAFEKGTLYNSKNMSLPYLAGELNTNTKYLSNVINRHKSSDFKSYINRLRINYIVDKLIHDEKYRQYKISILADECGFSSHSKFASVFKTVTDYSPSAFIKQLEAEHDGFQENG